MQYTEEMSDWFVERTVRHIELVRKYIQRVIDAGIWFGDSELKALGRRSLTHDASKFEEPERTPYIWITWMYKMKRDGVDFEIPEEIDSDAATLCHILGNRHHPEYHQDEKLDLLNREDRDGIPEKVIDAAKMSDIDIAEMCCDWSSVAEERGENSPREWADSVVNIRWAFTDRQVDLIYGIIDTIWDTE